MSTKTALLNYVRNELARGRNVTVEDDLLSTGVINSLGILQLVSFIEERFDIRVPDEDIVFENFHTVEALSTYLDNS